MLFFQEKTNNSIFFRIIFFLEKSSVLKPFISILSLLIPTKIRSTQRKQIPPPTPLCYVLIIFNIIVELIITMDIGCCYFCGCVLSVHNWINSNPWLMAKTYHRLTCIFLLSFFITKHLHTHRLK